MSIKKDNVRAVALEVLLEVTENKAFIHQVLDLAMQKYQYWESKDRNFLIHLVYGTLERYIQIDYIIQQYSKVKIEKLRPIIRGILRMSVYQIYYMDRVPDSAVCNEAVNLVHKRGLSNLKAYVNAILRNISREKANIVFPPGYISYALPEWLVKLWSQKYTQNEIAKIAEAFLYKKPLTVRVNLSRAEISEIIEELQAEGMQTISSKILPEVLYLSDYSLIEKISCIQDGRVYIQDLSSAMVAKLAGIQKGDRVLDLCAAPGGKTIHAGDILNGSGSVFALDISEKKIEWMRDNILRSKLQNIQTEVWNATEFRKEFLEYADIVLADVPCSGLGVLGNKPDIKLHTNLDICKSLAKLQAQILENASYYVKPGGKLVYSTCTIHELENEENIRKFLKNHKEFQIVNLKEAMELKDLQERIGAEGFVQLLPNNEMDGFFICVMQKLQK